MAGSQLQTPVAFMIFNRPETTACVFEAIRQARPTTLLVVADGPRPNHPEDMEKCAVTRAIIDHVDWECRLLTNYSETNLGCGHRISSGISWVFEQVEEAIILEDDCLPHPDFFPFCANLLERYRDDERIMMIGGSNFLGHFTSPSSYLFSRYYAIWGWATWRRAWQKYHFALPDWDLYKTQKQIRYCYPQRFAAKYVTSMFDLVQRRNVDTWDIQWFYTCLFNNGLSIVPGVNLVANIGNTAGTHTIQGLGEPPLPTFSLEAATLHHPNMVFADRLYDEAVFRLRMKTSLFKRAWRKALFMRQQWIEKRSLTNTR